MWKYIITCSFNIINRENPGGPKYKCQFWIACFKEFLFKTWFVFETLVFWCVQQKRELDELPFETYCPILHLNWSGQTNLCNKQPQISGVRKYWFISAKQGSGLGSFRDGPGPPFQCPGRGHTAPPPTEEAEKHGLLLAHEKREAEWSHAGFYVGHSYLHTLN